MSFFDSLNRLQHAPVAKRKFILVILVIIGMAAVIGLWILQLQYIGYGETSNDTGAESIGQPFGLLWGTMNEGIKNGFKSLYEK